MSLKPKIIAEKINLDKNGICGQDKEYMFQDYLIDACTAADINKIKQFFNDRNANDFLKTGWTPLLYASSSSNVESIKYLLSIGADSNIHKDGFTPLMALCSSTRGTKKDCLDCLSLLIKASANTEATNKYKQTALMYACKTKDVDFVTELLKHIKNINACDNEGQTALMYAVLANKIEVVKLLLNNQADITIKSRRYQTAKNVADLKGYEKISSLLSDEDNVPVTYEVSQIEDWKDLFPRLCPNKDQVIDYDVATILYGMGLEAYSQLFQGIELRKFLQLTEKDLLHLGLDISVHRDRFLKYLYKFHCKTWSMQSIGGIDKSKPYTFYNGFVSMGTITKQISVMTSTFCYIKNNLDNVSGNTFANDEQAFEFTKTIESTEKALANLKKELFHVKVLANKINVENRLPAPPLYIGPKERKYLGFSSIIFTVLLAYGIYLVKLRVHE